MQTTEQRGAAMPIETIISIDEVESSDTLRNQVQDLRAELDVERDLRLRRAAEFDNYRRRVRDNQAELAEAGKREMLAEFVSMGDDLDLALKNLNESSGPVADALKLLHRRFQQVLQAHGVVPFESEGDSFDPERHEAFAVVNDSGRGSGTVHEELRKGYFWNDRLFRPAMVVVSQ